MFEVCYETTEVVIVRTRVSDDVKKKQDQLKAKGCCLGCENKLPESGPVRRGLCAACYQAVRRAIDRKTRTEGQLIREGKMLPKSLGGRPSTNKFTQELAGG